MRPEIRDLTITELIVHDVPSRLARKILRETPDIQEEQPVFSQIPSTITQEISSFFHGKIASTIGSTDSIDIVFTDQSQIKDLIEEYFICDVRKRVDISQEIAQHLFEIQNAQNSGGLLLFILCECGHNKIISILKVEREEGVRVRQQTTNGLMALDIQHISDLILSKKTKLFKIVMYYYENGEIKGILCDKQRGYGSKEVADFFLCDFLGCAHAEEPQIQTKRFFEASQRFINLILSSSELKGELLSHLISELLDQRHILNPTDFARRALAPEYQDDYIAFLNENNSPLTSFPKNITMIESKLKQVRYEFTSGVKVMGSHEAFNSVASVSDLENGQTKMEIIDNLQQVKTK